MENLTYTFINIILPIFLIIILGFITKRLYSVDVRTLSKLLFQIMIPSMMFVKIYESELSGKVVTQVILTTVIVMSIVVILSYAISTIRGYSNSEKASFINSNTYFNCGNYSLPLIQMLFSDPMAVAVQSIIVMIHNPIFFTFGLLTSGSGEIGFRKTIMYILKLPMLYVILFAFILKSSDVPVWNPVWTSLNVIANGYSPLALLTLGIQLGNTEVRNIKARTFLSSFIRLIAAPIIGFFVVYALGITGLLAQVLIIAMAAPTAVNVVLSAIEFNNDPTYASQTILVSTVLSSITMPLVIWLVFKYIPIEVFHLLL